MHPSIPLLLIFFIPEFWVSWDLVFFSTLVIALISMLVIALFRTSGFSVILFSNFQPQWKPHLL